MSETYFLPHSQKWLDCFGKKDILTRFNHLWADTEEHCSANVYQLANWKVLKSAFYSGKSQETLTSTATGSFLAFTSLFSISQVAQSHWLKQSAPQRLQLSQVTCHWHSCHLCNLQFRLPLMLLVEFWRGSCIIFTLHARLQWGSIKPSPNQQVYNQNLSKIIYLHLF